MLLRHKPSSQLKGIDQSKCKYAGIYHTLPREAEQIQYRSSTITTSNKNPIGLNGYPSTIAYT